MMMFWILTIALVLVCLAIIAPPLMRTRPIAALDRDHQNVLIAGERIADLQLELDDDVLNQQEFEQAKQEVEATLLLDVDQRDDGDGLSVSGIGKGTLITLAAALPALAIFLYLQLGMPKLIDHQPLASVSAPALAQNVQSGEAPSMEDLLKRLTDRLKENPEDSGGWYMLGRMQMSMQQYDKAQTAFETTYKLTGDKLSVLLGLADSTAMNNGGKMAGRPQELIQKALQLAPMDITALWMAGMAAEEEGAYPEALEYLQRLMPLLRDKPDEAEHLQQMITRIQQNLGIAVTPMPMVASAQTPKSMSPSTGVRLKIRLSAELSAQVTPQDTIFVYAKAINGPRFPVSAARHQVSELPLEMTLDDSGAIMSSAKLSDFQQVLVGARVSKSGDAMTRSGDFKGEVSPVTVGDPGWIEIVIDRVVP